MTRCQPGCRAGATWSEAVACASLVKILLIAAAATLALYVVVVVALIAAGRRSEARALAGFIPDCVVLVGRLTSDPRVPRRRKALLALLTAYLALPFDLIPDFIPIAGQLDDVILLGVVLRLVIRSGGEELLDEHWPGPQQSLAVVRRAALGKPPRSPAA